LRKAVNREVLAAGPKAKPDVADLGITGHMGTRAASNARHGCS
jgi:hypothetical protein